VATAPLQATERPADASPTPPTIVELQNIITPDNPNDVSKESGLEIRNQALKEAALSYGARGGLANRTFQIQRRLAEHAIDLDRIYDFGRLLIAQSSGLVIEPPIVSEAQRAVLVAGGGQAAAVADRVLRINSNAQIVTAARNWRAYLERDWGVVEPPPNALLPQSADERAVWQDFVQKGWDAGVAQADDIYQADLDRLTTDFVGMVRYRELLAQGMISAPFAAADDRGVTGGGKELRVGDRGLTITAPSELNAKERKWQAIPQ
jgi:defect-in-organelle-trafficking protein DotC